MRIAFCCREVKLGTTWGAGWQESGIHVDASSRTLCHGWPESFYASVGFRACWGRRCV